MPRSYSLSPADAEPVVRAHLEEVLELTGHAVTDLENTDRLEELGLDTLTAALLITELHVATGVDPFARARGLAEVATVSEFVAVYREALAQVDPDSDTPPQNPEPILGAAAGPVPGPTPGPIPVPITALDHTGPDGDDPWPPAAPGAPAPEHPAAHEGDETGPGRRRGPLIGPIQERGENRYAAPLLFAEGADPEQRWDEDNLLEATRQLWTSVIPRHLLGPGRRVSLWTDRLAARFPEPVFPRAAILECVISLQVREAVCDRVTVTAEAYQADRRAAVFEAEIRVVPAAVARTYELLKAREIAPWSPGESRADRVS